MSHDYTSIFLELITAPFQAVNRELIWGIVPLYFGWLLNELTSSKASFRTAIQTGFSFMWAGAQWTYLFFHPARPNQETQLHLAWLFAVNGIVTLLVILLGFLAFVSGIRRRYPRYCSFLGHSRFSNYFMIAIYPIQSSHLTHLYWTWSRLLAIAIFAVPIWIALHYGLKPLRK